MNTVEASILLEEAIDLAAAAPDDAIYARLLAFRDGWFRNHRIGEFDATVRLSPVSVFRASPTATVEITGGKRVTVREGDEIAVRVGTYTLGPLVLNGVAYPGPVSVDWTEP